MSGNTRSAGAGSPSHELGGASRLFASKRAREIQAQEGVPLNVWGPPTSGNSTPLRENIPESPTDGFPDYNTQLPTSESMPPARTRARAGTVPTRFSPGEAMNGLGPLPPLATKSSRPTPSPSPFKIQPPGLVENGDTAASMLSRLRAGSMPQRGNQGGNYVGGGSSGPFGPSVFSTNWATGRERTSTLQSIASMGSNENSSPAQTAFSREGNLGENDMQMRTLDYLGLADTPQPPHATLANPHFANLADLTKHANRFRSYSVNAKERYAEEEEDDYGASQLPYESQQAQAQIQLQLAATQAAIAQHNLAVQAYANQASISRPRARTAGVLENPGARLLRNYYPTSSRLDNSISATELRIQESHEYDGLPEAVQALGLGRSSSRNSGGLLTADENNQEGPTKSLWLGSIPASTTVSTLTEMFKSYGPIQMVRVLTHKNCGFVNFERLDSAMSARAMMNNKEIFPGAGPVRINYAKPPSASGTPGHDGVFPSPSPDPFAATGPESKGTGNGVTENGNNQGSGSTSRPDTAALTVPDLEDLQSEILSIVKDFGATEEEKTKIGKSLANAVKSNRFETDIPGIPDPAHNRVHDAPKLRDIRKRIDNNSWSQAEIEAIAMEMLPEVAELSSDYLGNTVVQKLFEFCSNPVRDAMLKEISPHMAEIGVHKNGTWAAQKIIDVAKMPNQMGMIVDNLRPYTVPLFLDQYGNYVLQCCLRFGSPFNDFIFETMLRQMWDISQGRYGARAMRACLESHHATKDQQRMLAAAIALHSVQLATNANGALLLTWFLDTCTFPNRRTVLAPRLVPHLVHLCTHKVAYLTVLKVINQRNEAEARDTIFKALFFSPNDQVLEDILQDHACGATLIFKVLTTPFFDESIRPKVVENIRAVLQRLKAQPGQGYKRLMDEVGLSTRNGSAGPAREYATNGHSAPDRQRPGSQHSQANGHLPPQQFGNQYYPQMPMQGQPQFDVGMQRTESIESNMSPYPGYSLQAPMFSTTNLPINPLGMAQLQYHSQNVLARPNQAGNNFYPGMANGYGSYNTSSPAVDHFRNQSGMSNGSPVQPPSQMNIGSLDNFGPAAAGFGMGIGNGFPGGYGMGMQNMRGYMQAQQQQEPGRRGRR